MAARWSAALAHRAARLAGRALGAPQQRQAGRSGRPGPAGLRLLRTAAAARSGFDPEVMALYRLCNSNMVPMWQTLVETVGERTPTSPGTQLLDLASGPGNPSLQLAKAYPGLAVRCTDASEDMVEKAKGLAKDMGVEGVAFEVLDMQDLSHVPTASVDTVTVCLGFMFPDDLAKSIAEVHRVLKPGGSMISTTWETMAMMGLITDVMEKILGEKPPPPPINPMALRDNALEAPLLAQGFNVQSSDLHEIYFKLGNREEAWQVGTLTNRPFLNELQEAGKHGDVFATFRREFESIVDDWWVEDEGGAEQLVMPEPAVYRLIVATK